MDRNELAARYKKAVEGVLGLVATIDEDGDGIFPHPIGAGTSSNAMPNETPSISWWFIRTSWISQMLVATEMLWPTMRLGLTGSCGQS